MIRRNAAVEASLIDDLLDVTRLTRGKLEISLAPVDLHEIIRRAADISEPDIRKKRQTFTLTMQEGECTIQGDATRLLQVIWNILKNASKFTPEGGAITVTSYREELGQVIRVSDTGIGIDAQVLPNVFEAFTQGGDQISRQFGGLGLGLAISKAIVDAHQGSLQAESPGLGQGATFSIQLPCN